MLRQLRLADDAGRQGSRVPRLNLASLYTYIVGGIVTLGAMVWGGADTGWTFYVPYSTSSQTSNTVRRRGRRQEHGHVLLWILSRATSRRATSPSAATASSGRGGAYRGAREIDARGRIVVPGFIDTHLHVESSLVTPGEFDRCVLPHGVTTAICDPHEISNVLGAEGLRYFLDWSAERPSMDLRVQLSAACRPPISRPRARGWRPPTCCRSRTTPMSSAWRSS